MSILRNLPFSLCQSGPDDLDGVGNYYLQVFSQSVPEAAVLTIYLLDSHGEISSKVKEPDYEWIKQSQIDWFLCTSQELRRAREGRQPQESHSSLAFIHIPLPEYAERDLVIGAGRRREPTEGPSFNSHFFDGLAREEVAAVGCGHDHVNDFCARKPQKPEQGDHIQGSNAHETGPWLCYGGCSGFGGYCSYDGKRYHRRVRIWEMDSNVTSIKTWTRVEYSEDRNDEVILVKDGVAHIPSVEEESMSATV